MVVKPSALAAPLAALVLVVASHAHAQQAGPLDPAAPPAVDDPMLAPPAPAGRELGSWEEAISLSRARSTDLRTSLAETRRAEAQTRTALAALLPTLNASVSYPHQFLTKDSTVLGSPGAAPRAVSTPQSDYFNGNATLSQSIVNVQSWHSLGTAKENEKVARLSVEDTQRSIALGVATAVVGVVSSERVAELNRIGLRTALERRELAARKRALGVGTGLDLLRADQDVSASRAAIVSGDEALRRAREALGLAVGVPDQVGVARSIQVDGVAAEAERTCTRVGGIEARADIEAARQRLLVADRNVGNVERAFLPSVSAQSTLASTTADLGGAQPRTTWNITAVLSIPIWDGGARYGALRNARALRDESGFALEAQRRAVTVQIEQARRSVAVAEAALDVARQARQLAAEVDRLTQTAYRAGQGTSLELVIAASSLRQTEVGLALREFDVVRARLEALLALARCSGSR